VTLYGKGEAVAVSYSSSTGSRSTYLGKDVLGSVKTATTDMGAVEDRYEYDAFGTAYQGDMSGGMNLGYTGKPYDKATGLYNYGYRDYKPQVARFTTADPIRNGNNWFAYVNNDPVNYIDLWGLETTVMITHANTWWEKLFGGSHVAVFFSNPARGMGEKPTLYDPSGGYTVRNEVYNEAGSSRYRPSNGLFWDVPESTKDDFIRYESREGQRVTIYTIPTTPEQEARMIKQADILGNGFGFNCAVNVSAVLNEIGIKRTWFPGVLEKQLDKMVENGKATKNCGSK
jgi:RHS repeat-associated protein